MKWCYQDDVDITRSVVPRHPWCNQRASRNQRRQLRWTLLSSTMSNLLKQMKWWYPMSHLHSPRQVLSGEDPRQILQSVKDLIENTMSNRLNKWSVVTKADVTRSVLPRRSLHAVDASRQISAPITVNLIVKSDEQNIKQMKYCYPMSLIRLANSWRIFDSPRQFMDLWFASPIHGPRECDVVRRLSINLIVWWAQKILIQRSDITPTDLASSSICAASRRNWTINQTKVRKPNICFVCEPKISRLPKLEKSYRIKLSVDIIC